MSEFAGTLRERIEVWRRSEDRSAGGAAADDWTRLCRCLASIEAEGAGAEAEAMSISAMPRYRVTARTGPAFAIDQQIRWGTRRLAIRQMISEPRRPDRIILRCEEQR